VKLFSYFTSKDINKGKIMIKQLEPEHGRILLSTENNQIQSPELTAISVTTLISLIIELIKEYCNAKAIILSPLLYIYPFTI
jgi:hypothetical protein